jgi:NMD protein affecting ribosome stability and mRNA decay
MLTVERLREVLNMEKIKCIECGEERDDCDEDGLCADCFDANYDYEENDFEDDE